MQGKLALSQLYLQLHVCIFNHSLRETPTQSKLRRVILKKSCLLQIEQQQKGAKSIEKQL